MQQVPATSHAAEARTESPAPQNAPTTTATSSSRSHGTPEALDVRGERLCHAILEFAEVAEQEEPVGVYGTNISPDVMAAEALNSKNFRARISTEFVERFSGPLAAITKEFAAKGIQPSVHMVQPPPSGFEMRLGGQALCEMVSEYRQRNGIPYPPEVAEKIQNYRTLAPCLGIPAADDPFPGEKAVQIGTRAIDRANDIQQMANDCVKKMDGSDVDNDAQRRAFGNAVRLCCLDEIKKVHYAILSRCPTARDKDGERAYNLFLQEQAPGVTPSCDVDELAKYLREIGQTMKDLRELKR